MKTYFFNDSLFMPGTQKGPEELYDNALALKGTPGELYVKKRGIPLEVANTEGLRFAPSFNKRPAVVALLRNENDEVVSIHGRFIQTFRGENKMLTIGRGNGFINVSGGWKAEPLIIVEGMFDALSLAVSGWPAVAPIGRHVSWITEKAEGRKVWIAFDRCKPAERDFQKYKSLLTKSIVSRIYPPERCKDWNTALVKLGARVIFNWIQMHMGDNIKSTLPTEKTDYHLN